MCLCALVHTTSAQPSHCRVCEDYRSEVYSLIGTLNLYIHITVDMNGLFNCLKTSAPHCDTSITPGTLLDPTVPLTCSPLAPVCAQNATWGRITLKSQFSNVRFELSSNSCPFFFNNTSTRGTSVFVGDDFKLWINTDTHLLSAYLLPHDIAAVSKALVAQRMDQSTCY